MCDSLFWQSPADQGDLSDVVRASLQLQTPRHQLAAADMASTTNSSYLQLAEAEGGEGGQQQQLGDDHEQHSMLAPAYACDDDLLHALLPPRPIQHPQAADIEEPAELFGAHNHDHAHHHVPPIKRRKSQTKKVVCIPAASGRAGASGGEVVPSDLWAWRKYGQKPIKGSPYPRGYYRCSSSKGCSARKQVERSRADPTMLVVTYTSDHNHPWPTHRNALAGSTRPSAAKPSDHPAHHDQTDHHLPIVTRLKQEDDDPVSGLLAGVSMDMMISAASLLQPEQHQLGTLDSKHQLLFEQEYPHRFGFFD
ncbi:hypothetical protein E2562_035421 [Oryza meyeriana var. granulata]|uniref:WRKY domain-containing protein n=1 Tax=Oryza meyeriana var. granulata TaxID=110450 RepID=A0A6G1F1Y0_9ORYZ|nr:hypothetical protein E2562_035421 [Oryza meyeriana var. granulata]